MAVGLGSRGPALGRARCVGREKRALAGGGPADTRVLTARRPHGPACAGVGGARPAAALHRNAQLPSPPAPDPVWLRGLCTEEAGAPPPSEGPVVPVPCLMTRGQSGSVAPDFGRGRGGLSHHRPAVRGHSSWEGFPPLAWGLLSPHPMRGGVSLGPPHPPPSQPSIPAGGPGPGSSGPALGTPLGSLGWGAQQGWGRGRHREGGN